MAGEQERETEGWRMKGKEGERRWGEGAIGRQTPALLRKTNGWRGVCASVSLLYLFHQGGLIYDMHGGVGVSISFSRQTREKEDDSLK